MNSRLLKIFEAFSGTQMKKADMAEGAGQNKQVKSLLLKNL